MKLKFFTVNEDLGYSDLKILKGARIIGINNNEHIIIDPDHIIGLPKDAIPIFYYSSFKEYLCEIIEAELPVLSMVMMKSQ